MSVYLAAETNTTIGNSSLAGAGFIIIIIIIVFICLVIRYTEVKI